ncbi:MAG: hypothetical protein ABSF95_19050 [Verrucomicrobiota bacterium]
MLTAATRTGFGHYPNWHSDMDVVYFQFGRLIQAKKALYGPEETAE